MSAGLQKEMHSLYFQSMHWFDLCLSKLCQPKPILNSALAVLALGLKNTAKSCLIINCKLTD